MAATSLYFPRSTTTTTVKWILLPLCLSVVACTSVPVGRYQALRAASQDVLTKTSETYTKIEKRQRDFAVLTAPKADLTPNSFQPTINGTSFDIAPELAYRENALRAIVSYTELLESLAGKDLNSDVDRSVQELGASLRGLGGDSAQQQIVGGFTTVIDGLARGLTDRKRREALATAMDRAQPAIETLSQLLQGSNKKIAVFVELMRSSYVRHANAARPPHGTWARYEFDLEIADIFEEAVHIEEALKSASTAIGKLPQAHREIRESLDQRERPLAALRELMGEAKQLKGFYKNLATQ